MKITKSFLQDYMRVKDELENVKYRLELYLNEQKTTEYGMPRGNTISDPTAAKALIKVQLTSEIKELTEQEEQMRVEIMNAFKKIPYPIDRQIMNLRYIDGLEWSEIAYVVFNKKWDYLDREDKYVKKAYNIHSKALKVLKEL